MSKHQKKSANGTMLDLWRPPQGAGDPVGCLATTYTFAPGLFDEQCLARFLEIESEPNREDLAFLLERESRLGGIYAGVLVDYTQAGVEHSLRWDVLPVRVPAGKQHAKLSLLVWNRCVRIIVASANLSEPGYRTNYEVAGSVDLKPDGTAPEILAAAIDFLRGLLSLIPGAAERPPASERAEEFLRLVERQVRDWSPGRRGSAVRQQLVFTLPSTGPERPARSTLEEAVQACRRRGESPTQASIASPFFDADHETSLVTAALCKLLARGGGRELCFCLPALRYQVASAVPRLAAPRALLVTPRKYQASVTVAALPETDDDKNPRPWHAKLLALRADGYSALMIGSSNFTGAGMGVGGHRNAEANLLTVVDRVAYGREANQIEAVWPEVELIEDPEQAEWLNARLKTEEEQLAQNPPPPPGFQSATYRAGEARRILLRLEPAGLPGEWQLLVCGQDDREILSASGWEQQGRPLLVDLPWEPPQPPERLRVRWDGHEAFLPLNVEDGRALPPPAPLERMTAEDMLRILAAADPSAAFRAWTRQTKEADGFDSDLDSAIPPDLDPLHRYELRTTFLHRIRHRARVLAQLRANLQRPVWGRQALEWRLRGLIGIEPLAQRLVREFLVAADANGPAEEALLTLADFLIVLAEVDYQARDGSLPREEFEAVFRPFVAGLAVRLQTTVEPRRSRASEATLTFWKKVVARCQG